MASYDAALAAANLHNYNLVTVSSVIPGDAIVEEVGTAPDLGPAGNRLTVVQARATLDPDSPSGGRAAAGIGWTQSEEGPGLFYEHGDATTEAAIASRVREGLAAGRDLRDWTFTGERVRTVGVEAVPGAYATAVVVAAYGRSERI